MFSIVGALLKSLNIYDPKYIRYIELYNPWMINTNLENRSIETNYLGTNK